MSFNINGIKSFTKYIKEKYSISFNDYLVSHLKVDILCLQEVKCNKKDMDMFHSLKDYITYTNLNKHKNGIYGVSTIISKKLYCRKHSFKVPYSEYGRSILTDHKTFKILNLYFPFYDGSSNTTKESVIIFYRDIYKFISKFDDLIVVGDFNAVYSLFDHFVYYKEYLKIFSRKLPDQEHKIQIIDKMPDDFNKTNFIENYNKLIQKHSDENINEIYEKDRSTELFGVHITRFYKTSSSPYFNYIYESVRFLQNINLIFDTDTGNQEVDYKLDLIEKSSFSQTDLPYLVDTVSTLCLLLYSTFQRKWMLKLILELNFIDVFRLFHDGDGSYTCWNTLLNLRSLNMGTRIDYILIPIKLINRVIYADILNNVYGSDHCPVFVNINLDVEDDNDNSLKVQNNILGFLQKKK
jgi:exonuclease III